MLASLWKKITGSHDPEDVEDSFIRLTQLMKQDANLKGQILAIASAEPGKRQKTLTQLIAQIQQAGAPQDHVQIFQYLMQPELCDRLLSFDWSY